MENLIGVFLSTPISGFSQSENYHIFRENVLKLIRRLRKSFQVCAEIELIDCVNKYDSPEKSVEDDFENIKRNEVFLFLHPAKMQSSSLIELGYAIGHDKQIVIAGKRSDLPYMAFGLERYSDKVRVIDVDVLSEDDNELIYDAVVKISSDI